LFIFGQSRTLSTAGERFRFDVFAATDTLFLSLLAFINSTPLHFINVENRVFILCGCLRFQNQFFQTRVILRILTTSSYLANYNHHAKKDI
jgi:hypothetical protein